METIPGGCQILTISIRFHGIPSEFPQNWKPKCLRLQPTVSIRILWNSDILLEISWIPLELMEESKYLLI